MTRIGTAMRAQLMFGLTIWFLAALGAAIPAAAANPEERIFPGTVDEVWAAARSALRSDGWEIASEDRVTGVIVTDVRDISFLDLGLVADGLRHSLRLAVRSLGSGQTAVHVTHDLFRERRRLWDTARRPRPPRDKQVEARLLDGIALFLPAGSRIAATPLSTSAATPPPGAPGPAAHAPRISTVMYRVTGSGGSVEVTYRDRHGQNDRQTATSLPWEISFESPRPPAQLYLSAVAQGATTQSVACEIFVDGTSRSQSVSVGAAAVAACSTAVP
jgi:hypothetical protein